MFSTLHEPLGNDCNFRNMNPKFFAFDIDFNIREISGRLPLVPRSIGGRFGWTVDPKNLKIYVASSQYFLKILQLVKLPMEDPLAYSIKLKYSKKVNLKRFDTYNVFRYNDRVFNWSFNLEYPPRNAEPENILNHTVFYDTELTQVS